MLLRYWYLESLLDGLGFGLVRVRLVLCWLLSWARLVLIGPYVLISCFPDNIGLISVLVRGCRAERISNFRRWGVLILNS